MEGNMSSKFLPKTLVDLQSQPPRIYEGQEHVDKDALAFRVEEFHEFVNKI